MTKVTLYESTDGQLHKTKALCEKQNRRLRAKPALDALVANTTWVFDRDERNNELTYKDGMAAFINDHSAAILKILSDAQTVKRAPRKPKAVKTAQPAVAGSQALAA